MLSTATHHYLDGKESVPPAFKVKEEEGFV